MKKLSRKLATIAITIGISLAMPLVSIAQNGPDYGAPKQGNAPADSNGQGGNSPSGTNQELICRGDRDYSTFLSAVLSYDGFTEYWKDILVRYNASYCQYLDIRKLMEQITKVRAQIRKAFYTCSDTRKLTDTYHNLEAELFFTRKFVDADNAQFLVKDDNAMYAQMRDYFVTDKSWFSEDQMKIIFQDFKDKYSARLDDYKTCSMDDNWSKLTDKWQDFKDNVVTIFTDPANNPIIKEAGASISKNYQKMANVSMFSGRSFFGGFLDAKINGLTPAEGWDQIAAEAKKNTPNGISFEDFKAKKDISDQRYQDDVLAANYITTYKTLYAETSDEYVKSYVERLDTLSAIINNTAKYQNQTINCVKDVNHKQC